MTPFRLRGFTPDDLPDCLRIFDSNIPRYFRVEERPDYVAFLDELSGPYFVLVGTSGAVVGCGGYALADGSDVADLCWGMVARASHGRGAGQALAQLRIDRVRTDGRVRAIALETSQLTSPFYERLGFRTLGVERDGYAPGLDRVSMRLEL
jgi:ribosomal protein S18 acetylase RimI-like enzyme